MGGLIGGILGLGAGAIGTALNQSAQHNRTAAINQIINQQLADYQLGRNTVFGTGNGSPGMLSNLADPSLTNANRQLQYLYGGDNGGAFGQYNDQNAATYNPGSLQQNYYNGQIDPYGQNTPGLQGINSQLQGMIPGVGQQSNLASQVFAGGGWSPQSQFGFDNLTPLAQGQGIGQQSMTNVANNIMGQMGQGPLSQMFQTAAGQNIGGASQNPQLQWATHVAQQIANAGGSNPNMDQGVNSALNTINSGGYTPSISGNEGNLSGIIANHGYTPATGAIQNIGVNLAGEPSLMPTNLVASMARDQSGTNYQQSMEAAQAQALRRGGGSGTTVANGLQNEGMADYADKGAQAQSAAVQQALLQHQQLQLQQQNQGATEANNASGLQTNLFGTGGGILNSLENTAANRYGTGTSGLQNMSALQSQNVLQSLGMIPGIQQTGGNLANIYGNLGLGSGQLDLSNINSAGNLYGNVLNSQLGAQNSYNSLLNGQNQYALGAGGLANSGNYLQGSLLNDLSSNNLTAAGQGLSRLNGFYSQNQQGLNNQSGLMNFSGTQQQNSNNTYGNLLDTILNWGTGQGNAGHSLSVGNAPSATNPWGGLLSSFGNGLSSGAFGNFGGFGGGGGGNLPYGPAGAPPSGTGGQY